VQAPGDIGALALPEGPVALQGARALHGGVLGAVDGPLVPAPPHRRITAVRMRA
jgi:hypothetical protein